jgi:hypothetical protein
LVPRQDLAKFEHVPADISIVEWQEVAAAVRTWRPQPALDGAGRFIVAEYLAYLREENLMAPDLLTVEHAFALRANNDAAAAIAGLMEHAEALIQHRWGTRQPRGAKAYGPGYWRHFKCASGEARAGADSNWRDSVFEWGMFQDSGYLEDPRNAWVFLSGATMGRKSPAKVAGNEGWLAERRDDGFEYNGKSGLYRHLYPEELLAATTFDEQVERLGSWVVESFQLLERANPPH